MGVRATPAHGVGQQSPVAADFPVIERDGSVRRERIGIEQHVGVPVEPVQHVEDVLVLQSRVPKLKVMSAALPGRADACMVPQFSEPLPESFTCRDALEMRERELVLRGNPLTGSVRIRVLQPAIWIVNALAVIIIVLLNCLSGRIGRPNHSTFVRPYVEFEDIVAQASPLF